MNHLSNPRTLFSLFLDFLGLALISLVAPLTLYLDIVVFAHGVGEMSLTEISQSLALLISAACMFIGAKRHPDFRCLFVVAFCFLASMFVRELDAVFDNIRHGFWIFLVIPILIFAAYYSFTSGRIHEIRKSASLLASSQSYTLISFGLVIILVFSRVFGSGSLLWKKLLGPAYNHQFKSALQEGLELFGYVLLAKGIFSLMRTLKPENSKS